MHVDLKLRPDQLEEVAFLQRVGRGASHSPPGKGKTAIAMEAATLPITVSAPGYAIQKWADWLQAHVPNTTGHVYIAASSTLDKYDRFNIIADAAADPHHVLLVAHDMLRPETEEYESAGLVRKRAIIQNGVWRMEYPLPQTRTAILDEAHWLRGRNAWRARGAVNHFRNTPNVFELTASPIYTDADDMYMQLRILAPSLFTSYGRFVQDWCRVWNNGWKDEVLGLKDSTAFNRFTAAWATRHDYAPGELPPVMELPPIVVQPNSLTRRRMQELRRVYRDPLGMSYATAIEALTAIERITAADPDKLDALMHWIADNRPRTDGTRRGAFILCHLHETVEVVTAKLRQLPNFMDSCAIVTGNMPQERRARAIAAASNVIGTWGSMSENLDASHLRLVVPYELEWTFGGKFQGIGRVVRPRNDNDVDPEPVLVQSIQLAGSLDTVKASKIAGRTRTVQEALAAALNDA